MATLEEWAEFFSGDYIGRFRVPPGDWEDLIGIVRLRCSPGEGEVLQVSIESAELSGWTGAIDIKEMVLTIFSGKPEELFRCVFRKAPSGSGGDFFGEYRQDYPGPPMTEMSLTMKRPAPPPA